MLRKYKKNISLNYAIKIKSKLPIDKKYWNIFINIVYSIKGCANKKYVIINSYYTIAFVIAAFYYELIYYISPI